MFKNIKNIKILSGNHTTHRVGLLQAKVYRILKTHTANNLITHNISTIEWAFLGLIHDNPQGIRFSDAADEMGVEAPFITVLIKDLKKQRLVTVTPDSKDSRVKLIFLSPHGKKFVTKVENELKEKMRPLINDVTVSEIAGYLSVLEKIIKNSDL